MKIDQPADILDALGKTLERLSSPADVQINYLRTLGVSPSVDELALEFDDLAALVPQLVKEGHVTWQQAQMVQTLDRKLTDMSNLSTDNLWIESALWDHPDWEEVRRLASMVVKSLGLQ